MAATRLIALHVNKGKTVAQCLADRTDYSQNAAKTNDGEFISSYECDPKTADEEFLLSKRQYQHITGRQQKNNIIAYQIRQSFKPGEITPEEANQVGYETAMRWTKGKHAFIVATHIDKSHIHNHNPAFREASVVQLEQIRTIDKCRIDNYLGKVTPHEMVAIEKALSISLAMEQLKKQTGSAAYKYRKNPKE